jgi:probable rRNA maturation factor
MSCVVHVNAPALSREWRTLLRRAARRTLREGGVADGELSVTLLEDAAIQAMNRDYLGHDRVTDVISFALHASDQPVLGDVYLGVQQAERQSAEAGVPLPEELVRLVVHGTLHVLGHDHPEGEDRLASPMFQLQEQLVEEILGGAKGPPGGSSRSGRTGRGGP